MRFAKPNETVPLFVQLDAGGTGLYPQARVINALGQVVQTVNLIDTVGNPGHYRGNAIFTATGDYSVRYTVYADAARTTEATNYNLSEEPIRITLMEETAQQVNNIGNVVGQLRESFQSPVAEF